MNTYFQFFENIYLSQNIIDKLEVTISLHSELNYIKFITYIYINGKIKRNKKTSECNYKEK